MNTRVKTPGFESWRVQDNYRLFFENTFSYAHINYYYMKSTGQERALFLILILQQSV